LHTGLRKRTAVILLIVFALSSPLGTLTSYFLGKGFVENMSHFFNIILAMVVGIFLHISTTILFESDENHGFNLKKFIVIVLGFGATIILSIVIH
jgi:zinc and cadmium transporter